MQLQSFQGGFLHHHPAEPWISSCLGGNLIISCLSDKHLIGLKQCQESLPKKIWNSDDPILVLYRKMTLEEPELSGLYCPDVKHS